MSIQDHRKDHKLFCGLFFNKNSAALAVLFFLCRREDLNLHGLPRLLLRQVRLPISPPRHIVSVILYIKTGALSRDRTYDLILKRDLLYQLSYERILNLLLLKLYTYQDSYERMLKLINLNYYIYQNSSKI